MIAPIRNVTDSPSPSEALVRARRTVAELFLADEPPPRPTRTTSAWRAWLAAAWMAGVLLAYVVGQAF